MTISIDALLAELESAAASDVVSTELKMKAIVAIAHKAIAERDEWKAKVEQAITIGIAVGRQRELEWLWGRACNCRDMDELFAALGIRRYELAREDRTT